MHAVVETWTPKAAFMAASPEARAAFFQAMGADMNEMTNNGVESLGWGQVELSNENSTEQKWSAVWRMSDADAAVAFLAAVAASGWYDYFEQTNVRGELRQAETVIAEHMKPAA